MERSGGVPPKNYLTRLRVYSPCPRKGRSQYGRARQSHGSRGLPDRQVSRDKFTGAGIAEIADLVQSGIIRVIDLVFLMRDETGELVKVEAKDLQGEMGNAYRELARHTDEWFSEADIEVFAEGLAKNSSAALLLFENVWAIRFKEALKNADAE